MNFIASAWEGVTQLTVANCMRKAGFHLGLNAAGGEVEDEVENVDPEDWARLGGQGSFEDFVESDSDVVTSELMSLDDIIAQSQSDSEEEGESAVRGIDESAVPKFGEAIAAFEQLQAFLLSRDLLDEEQLILSRLSNILYKQSKSQVKQTKISDFFA